jgi:hypothetical protein
VQALLKDHPPQQHQSDAPSRKAQQQQPQQLPFPVEADARPLFTPLQLGALQLQHRAVMAPLTRCR